ncbi:hypothetical protein [Haloferax marisrubri]|nr:hypothetical protein [Haloferax marisrubri]
MSGRPDAVGFEFVGEQASIVEAVVPVEILRCVLQGGNIVPRDRAD